MSTDIEKPDIIGATRRAETIRSGMIGYAAAMEAIGEAFEARDWVALGHKNWDEYCEKEFSEKRLKLNQQQREQAVLAFRHAGMSIRAIGSALGVSPTTVQSHLYQSGTPAAVVGVDGKTYVPPVKDSPADLPQPPDAVEDDVPVATDGQPETDPGGAAMAPGASGESPSSDSSDDAQPPAEDGVPPAGEASEDGSLQPSSGGPKPKPPVETEDERANRERMEFRTARSMEFAESLVNLTQRLDDDAVTWFQEVYLLGVYPHRDLPTVRDCFTPTSMRVLAKQLGVLADYLEATGEVL